MYEGTIRTRDILFHPLPLIAMRGFKGYFKILWRALSRKKYRFVNHIEKTQWFYLDEKKK